MSVLIKEYKAPLSWSIQKEYHKLMEALSQVPTQMRNDKKIEFTSGKASVTDIIAYQIGWGKLLISWYEAVIHDKIPQMPGAGFTKWDYAGLAEHFFLVYHYNSTHEQQLAFHDTVEQILAIVEKEYQTSNLDKTDVWSWCTLASGKKWPLSKWITVNTISPYKRASALLRSFTRSLLK